MTNDGIRFEITSTNVKGCSSCGHDHAKLVVEKLDQPKSIGFGGPIWTHIAKCPNTNARLYICAVVSPES
jgi:hypothetical protein